MYSNSHAYKKELVETVNQYSTYLSLAVTLTMKQKATIRMKRFENWDGEYNEWEVRLDEAIAKDTLNYFYARLTHYTFGKDARRTSTKWYSQPVMLAALEGTDGSKRLHWHLALGNLPAMQFWEASDLIAKTWSECDFAYKQIQVKPLTHTYGWLDYMAKEVHDGNMDAICIDSIKQPQSIQQLVGAESR